MTKGNKTDFSNVYEDTIRAEAYSRLTFDKTYYLAYRDLPTIIARYTKGKNALDFGCGTGRSTRFLQTLGYRTIGIDISEEMIRIARQLDPAGEYHRIDDGDFSRLPCASFDLILSAFTFDNIPTMERKIRLFRRLSTLITPNGALINLVSSPEIYTHEWASFTTKDFPENNKAKTGDIVRIITIDIADKRPCDDIYISEEDYATVYTKASLRIIKKYKPLATGKEPYQWVNETQIAPWTIYVLRKKT
ncbi:MAG TPA: class I SAM-dependent methyltransferase [Thermoplasmata archaeon]|jgi:ubiquinone/menaquinone biosynthesis C-methylase UbiE|nr:class I SAM-dependent methyltransferase [Thermoplasmata archaeon]